MLTRSDIDAVVEFSIRAWAQVFESFELALGDVMFERPLPDWRSMQAHLTHILVKNSATAPRFALLAHDAALL